MCSRCRTTSPSQIKETILSAGNRYYESEARLAAATASVEASDRVLRGLKIEFE